MGPASKLRSDRGRHAFQGVCLRLGLGACLCLAALGWEGDARAQTVQLRLTTEDAPPFNMSDDGGKTVYGQVADKIHELMRRAGISYQVELLGWQRALAAARILPNNCVFTTARIAERETWFKWIGPVASSEWILWGAPDKLGRIERLEQAKTARIGSYHGDAVARYLNENGYYVVLSSGDEVALKNLLLGRLDYWASSRVVGTALIARNNARDKVVPLFAFKSIEYYLACNPATPDQVVEELREALRKINADGTAARIEQKYRQ